MPRNSTAVLNPNLGLFLDRPSITVPPQGLSAGDNFRIKEGKLSNLNLGWSQLDSFALDGAVTLVYGYFDRDGTQIVIFGDSTDLYKYSSNDVTYLTPIEATGTVDVSAADPAVVTEDSGTSDWDTIGIKAGDQISFGSATETALDATWYTVDTVDTNDQLTLTTAVAGAPLAATTFTIRRLFTGDQDTPWSAVTFLHEPDADEDLFIATNGVDDVVTWNGSDTACTIQSLGFKAKHLSLFKNMVIATAITDTGEFLPAQMRNSDAGDPLEFSAGLASALTVHDGYDKVSPVPLGDSLILYSQDHVVVADFVGDPFVFVLRTALASYGPLAARLVADHGDYHDFLGKDAKYRFDGVTSEEHNNQVWREVLRQRDPTRLTRAWNHFDLENGDLIWALPLLGDSDTTAGPRTAYVEHYLEDVGQAGIVPVSRRAMPFTAPGYYSRQTTLTWDQISDMWEDLNFRWNDIFFSAAFPFNLMGDASGELFTLNTAQTGDGSALASYVRAGRRALGDTRMRGLLHRVYPFATRFADRTLAVRTRRFDSAQGPLQSTDEVSFDLDMAEGGHFATVHRRARFYELEFAQDSGTAWELAGWDVDVRPGGYR